MAFTPPELFGLVLWLGMVMGLGEWALTGIVKLKSDRIILIGPDTVWMAPLANVAFLGVAAIALVLVARRWPLLVSRRVVLFLSVWILCWSLAGAFLSVKFLRLHRYTWPILAAGIAVQVVRTLRPYFASVGPLVRRTAPVLLLLIALATGLIYGRQWHVQRRAIAALPVARPSAPNVLLVVLDTVRAQNLSLYGYSRDTTPYLSELAQSGVVFESAVSTSPWTLPSHGSLFTGRLPHELAASWRNPLDGRHPTLAGVLQQHGYVTAGFVANWGYTTSDSGLNRGFIHYDDYPVSIEMAIKSSWMARTFANFIRHETGNIQDLARQSATDISSDFTRWLARRPADKPFFAFLNLFDAHGPYLPPAPFHRRFGSGTTPPDFAELRRDWTPQQIQDGVDAYDGALAFLDERLRALVAELETRQLLQNTMVIVTSDHGEQLGEHQLFDHGNSLYWPLLHVPLMIVFPAEVPAGKRVKASVSLRDVPATILDLLNLRNETRLPGRSLAEYWKADRGALTDDRPLLSEVDKGINLPAWSPVSRGNMKSVVLNGMHYIRNGDGSEELYELESDRLETRNLAQSPAHQAVVGRFRTTLSQLLQSR